jgi:hypothetical protein
MGTAVLGSRFQAALRMPFHQKAGIRAAGHEIQQVSAGRVAGCQHHQGDKAAIAGRRNVIENAAGIDHATMPDRMVPMRGGSNLKSLNGLALVVIDNQKLEPAIGPSGKMDAMRAEAFRRSVAGRIAPALLRGRLDDQRFYPMRNEISQNEAWLVTVLHARRQFADNGMPVVG